MLYKFDYITVTANRSLHRKNDKILNHDHVSFDMEEVAVLNWEIACKMPTVKSILIWVIKHLILPNIL